MIFGKRAAQIRRICLIAEAEGDIIVTPEENFIPRFNPQNRGRRPARQIVAGLAPHHRTAAPLDHCADILERCGKSAREGETAEAAVDRLLTDEADALLVTQALHAKCCEMRALSAHLRSEESAQHCAAEAGSTHRGIEVLAATIEGEALDTGPSSFADESSPTHSSMPSLFGSSNASTRELESVIVAAEEVDPDDGPESSSPARAGPGTLDDFDTRLFRDEGHEFVTPLSTSILGAMVDAGRGATISHSDALQSTQGARGSTPEAVTTPLPAALRAKLQEVDRVDDAYHAVDPPYSGRGDPEQPRPKTRLVVRGNAVDGPAKDGAFVPLEQSVALQRERAAEIAGVPPPAGNQDANAERFAQAAGDGFLAMITRRESDTELFVSYPGGPSAAVQAIRYMREATRGGAGRAGDLSPRWGHEPTLAARAPPKGKPEGPEGGLHAAPSAYPTDASTDAASVGGTHNPRASVAGDHADPDPYNSTLVASTGVVSTGDSKGGDEGRVTRTLAGQELLHAVLDAAESASKRGFGLAGKGPGPHQTPNVIVGVGDPPTTPYVLGPPGEHDLVVVRYRATPNDLADDLARAGFRPNDSGGSVSPARAGPDTDHGTQTSRPPRRGRGGRGADGQKGQHKGTHEEPWVPTWRLGKFGDRKCRDGGACRNAQCGFAHPPGWSAVTPHKPKGKHVKGPDELEDRSFHRVDGITGQAIGRRRQRHALAREQFYGTTLDADGREVINDSGGSDT